MYQKFSFHVRVASVAMPAMLGILLTGCSVLPDAPAPQPTTIPSSGNKTANSIGLDDVIVIGHSPFDETGGGSGGYDSGGGFPSGGGGTQGPTTVDNSGGGGGDLSSAFDENTDLIESPTQVGDYAKTIRMKSGGPYSDIETRIEIDLSTHKILKISSVLSGVTKFRSLTQVGDGVQIGYDASIDRYYFNFAVQITYLDGSASNGIKDVYGWISPRAGTAAMKFD